MTGKTHPIPLKCMVEALVEEVGFRQRAYPKWIKDGQMKAEQAHAQIAVMRAALDEIINLEKVDFTARTKIKVVALTDNRFEITGAFNGYSMENIALSEEDCRDVLEQHEISAVLIDLMLGKQKSEVFK